MKKIILNILCITTLAAYTVNAHGMTKITALMNQASTISAKILHAIPETWKTILQYTASGACSARGKLVHLKRSTAKLVSQGIHTTKVLPGMAYRQTVALVQQHPKKSIALGALAAFLIARSNLVRNAIHTTKQFSANRLLRSNNRYLIACALKLGVNVNHRFADGKTALHIAAEQGRADIVEYLILKGAHISPTDNNHFKPLHYAAANGYIDVVQLLIHSGENIDVATEDPSGQSPLHIAAAAGQLEMVRRLIQYGANDQLLTNNQTAQAIAAVNGHHNVAQYLTQIRPDSVHDWFTNILHNAIDENEVQRTCIAINSGAHMVSEDHDNTPLIRAIGTYNADHATLRDEIAERLVRAGAPLHIADRAGNTPLHCAIAQGNRRLVELFLVRGANVHARNNAHQTALDIALRNAQTHLQNRPLVTLLINNGAHLTDEQMRANAWLNEEQHPNAGATMQQ